MLPGVGATRPKAYYPLLPGALPGVGARGSNPLERLRPRQYATRNFGQLPQTSTRHRYPALPLPGVREPGNRLYRIRACYPESYPARLPGVRARAKRPQLYTTRNFDQISKTSKRHRYPAFESRVA